MAPRRIIDVSVGITEQLPVWPGDPSIQIERTSLIERGAPANVSRYHLGSHTGTHLDPPFHFIDGAPTVESLDLSILIGSALVVELPDVAENVSAVDLEVLEIPAGTERLLLKTRNSKLWTDERHKFDRGFVAVGRSGAEWLVERGVKLVGVDYLSVESFHSEPGNPVHRTLLSHGVIVVEGLNLGAVMPGDYELVCLPLKIVGGDGAPARTVLIASD